MAGPPGSLNDEGLESQMSKSVIDYVIRHPQAMDTVEGIASWWIAGSKGVDHGILQRVLDQLAAGGVLEKLGTANRTHYRLRKESETSS